MRSDIMSALPENDKQEMELATASRCFLRYESDQAGFYNKVY